MKKKFSVVILLIILFAALILTLLNSATNVQYDTYRIVKSNIFNYYSDKDISFEAINYDQTKQSISMNSYSNGFLIYSFQYFGKRFDIVSYTNSNEIFGFYDSKWYLINQDYFDFQDINDIKILKSLLSNQAFVYDLIFAGFDNSNQCFNFYFNNSIFCFNKNGLIEYIIAYDKRFSLKITKFSHGEVYSIDTPILTNLSLETFEFER